MAMNGSPDDLETVLRRYEVRRVHERAAAADAAELAAVSRRLMARFLADHDYRFLNLALKLNDALRRCGTRAETATLDAAEAACMAQVRRLTGLDHAR